MGMKISVEQSVEAAELRSKAVNERFSGTGIIAETVLHADGVIGNRGGRVTPLFESTPLLSIGSHLRNGSSLIRK